METNLMRTPRTLSLVGAACILLFGTLFTHAGASAQTTTATTAPATTATSTTAPGTTTTTEEPTTSTTEETTSTTEETTSTTMPENPPTGPDPTIAGIARVGETLTASVGPWTGEGPLTTSWSWARMESPQAQSADEIDGATSNTYTLTAADVGMYVVVAVQVTGATGTGYGNASIGPVLAAPVAGGASQATSTGGTITVSGSGFGPDTDVTVVLQSDPVTLGVAHTDATGSFTATFPLPAGVTAGVHTLVFTGVDAAGNPVTVVQSVEISAAAAAGTLPVTGSDTLPLTLVAGALILGGVLALRESRRRASPAL
jgi:hypothetical protein